MAATILVVDDEIAIVDLLSDLLGDEGYGVVAARDGIAALALLDRHRPDLLLTDHMMPRLSGLALIARLHDRPDPPPIILMSAARPEPPPRVAFLPKPFDLDALLALVARLLPPGPRELQPQAVNAAITSPAPV